MTLLLVALAGLDVALGVMAWRALAPTGSKEGLVVAPPRPRAKASAEIEAVPARPPIESYDQIVARPLFAKSRAPWAAPAPALQTPAALTQAAEPEPDISGVELRAVVIAPGMRKALISTSQQVDGRWLRTGEEFQGWRVAAIEARGVKLSRGALEKSLRLFVGSADSQDDRVPGKGSEEP